MAAAKRLSIAKAEAPAGADLSTRVLSPLN